MKGNRKVVTDAERAMHEVPRILNKHQVTKGNRRRSLMFLKNDCLTKYFCTKVAHDKLLPAANSMVI